MRGHSSTTGQFYNLDSWIIGITFEKFEKGFSFVQFIFRVVGNGSVKVMKHDSGMEQQMLL